MKITSKILMFAALLVGGHSAEASLKSFSAKDLLSGKEVVFPKAQSKATVVVFLSAKCPCSASHEASLKSLYDTYSKDGFEFVGVHSNQDENEALGLAHFKNAHFPFPIVHDSGAKIADELKALKTPHVFILKGDEVVFQGGVDDSAEAANAKKRYLAEALKSLKEGKPIETTRARALGCVIKR